MNIAIDDGRFLKVDPGNAARLLALLSLQSIGRTLAADGGSQFTEGFAFASIRADATIDRGLLKTDNFRMNGASAAVLMSGTLDLGKETQQLSIVVLPEIDASTAALAVGGCQTPTTDTARPADHTVNKSGAYHKTGLTSPTVNCVQCHGTDLKGGSGPSCFKCHGQKW